MLTHFAKKKNKKIDGIVHAVGDSRTMDEKDTGCDPARKCERRPKFSQKPMFLNAPTESHDTFDRAETPLAGAKRRCKYRRPMRWIGC